MIVINENKWFINRKIIWFAPERQTKIEHDYDIIEYYQIDKLCCQTPTRQSKTLINDLSLSEEQLFSKFAKNTRYEINRAKREGVVCKIFSTYELSNEKILEELAEYYIEFLNSKNLPSISVSHFKAILKRYADGHNLIISCALYEENALVYHYYIHDKAKTRLLYSASHFRTNSVLPKNLSGMANRLLHWEDMKYFKENGLVQYDWGGYSSDPQLKGINDFKLGFGGELQDTYYITICKTIKAKIIMFFLPLIIKIRRGIN